MSPRFYREQLQTGDDINAEGTVLGAGASEEDLGLSFGHVNMS